MGCESFFRARARPRGATATCVSVKERKAFYFLRHREKRNNPEVSSAELRPPETMSAASMARHHAHKLPKRLELLAHARESLREAVLHLDAKSVFCVIWTQAGYMRICVYLLARNAATRGDALRTHVTPTSSRHQP